MTLKAQGLGVKFEYIKYSKLPKSKNLEKSEQSYSGRNMMDKKNIMGVSITNATKKEILEYVVKNLENFKKKLYFVTPNPEFLVLANKNSVFKNILNKADLASADGIGMIIVAKILGKSLKERFAGVDLMESLCKEVAEKPITVGFLGGRAGVAEATAECLGTKYPSLKIAFVGEEWNEKRFLLGNGSSKFKTQSSKLQFKAQNYEKDKISGIPFSNPRESIDILFVAFGAPKQEFWINENLSKIPVKIAIGVGGAFDYISGKVPRAPLIVRKLGMEWLFRLAIQPWRFKRQLALLEFIWLVVKEKLKKN